MPTTIKLIVIFNPAVSLMKRLNFTKKTVVIASVILLTFGVLAVNLYQELNRQIKTAEQELVGLKLLPPLFNFCNSIEGLQQVF